MYRTSLNILLHLAKVFLPERKTRKKKTVHKNAEGENDPI